jgi:hypothetical protein
MLRSNFLRENGSATLLAALGVIILGTALVLAQLNATKTDTNATNAAQSTVSVADQAAQAAAIAGVAYVNGLSSGTQAARLIAIIAGGRLLMHTQPPLQAEA